MQKVWMYADGKVENQTRKMSSREMVRDYIYNVYQNDKRMCQCGSIQDAELMVLLGDNRRYERVKCISPQTVDVNVTHLPPDPQLPEQNILPDRQETPIDLTK